MRAILDCSVVHVPDVQQDREVSVWIADVVSRVGYRSLVAVPMLREGTPVGAISVAKREPSPAAALHANSRR
jgi:two-component system NtrC family sensor kinase